MFNPAEMKPPWMLFPRLKPETFAHDTGQGLLEAWYEPIWLPYWRSLSEEQKKQYFQYWNATRAWESEIRLACDVPNEADLRADKEESEAYLKKWNAERATNETWIDRMKRKLRGF
jgi:hypothetical protein